MESKRSPISKSSGFFILSDSSNLNEEEGNKIISLNEEEGNQIISLNEKNKFKKKDAHISSA
jgi:hypothetical protein